MSEFISGDEAKLAWAKGEKVQWRQSFDWNDLGAMNILGIFDDEDIEFRLKPRTVNLNGIEVPSVKYVAHSGGNCVKISCECPEDAAAISAALRNIFGKK